MFVKVVWLSICVLAITLLFWIAFSDNETIIRFRRRKWILYPIYILAIIIFSSGIRIFIIEIYAIPSGSMKDTILPGDKVLLSKLSYGPRLPSTPFDIPWVNLGFFLNKRLRAKVDSVWWGYKRFHGLSRVNYNQVVVFNFPEKPAEIMIKRCMGLPGDTISILDERVYTNQRALTNKGEVKLFSRVIFNDFQLANSLFDSIGLNKYQNRSSGENYFSIYLNIDQGKDLLKNEFIDSVIIEKNRPDTSYHTFPKNAKFHWTIDNFGPLVIPAAGMNLRLNKDNFILYQKVINMFEDIKITTMDGDYFLNGIKAMNFTFKNNYYFMLGDNRHDSNDSRYWGFVPESYIIGKAVLILFSNGEDGFRWNRLFKMIK